MRVDCTANGSDPKARAAKYGTINSTNLGKKDGLRILCKYRRRKSSAVKTELITASLAASVGNEITSATVPEHVPDSSRNVCFSETTPQNSHHEPHPNDHGATDACRVEYLNEVSDESGASWHHIPQKSTSHPSSRPDVSSQSPRSGLADFGYAESAVGISKKASLEITDGAGCMY